jgi:hypothetical protein
MAQTHSQWPPITWSFNCLHKIATALKNEGQHSSTQVRHQVQTVLRTMARWKQKAEPLVDAIDYFLKVTRSYWSGLFHCYDIESLPRTNNDLDSNSHFDFRCSASPPQAG